MMARIVFIVNSLQNQRCIKRIKAFISHGCDVEVFAYSRQKDDYCDYVFPIHVFSSINNSVSYSKRFPVLLRDVKSVLNEFGTKEVLYYLFGLDIAMAFTVQGRGKYVYEESDLVHTYIGNSIIKRFLEAVDKWIIRKSVRTVFTSEGFLAYHYGEHRPSNVVVIPNKLNREILQLDLALDDRINNGCIKVGFVGKPRFKSVVSFAKVLCDRYNSFEFHIYGGPILEEVNGFNELEKYKNFFYHGPFKNPDDLARIYSSIDIVLSTYDIEFENVRFAEPNKFYEAIFFRTPIIVSDGSYLGDKVKKLGVGFCVNPLDENAVVELLNSLTPDTIREAVINCEKINRDECVDSFGSFVEEIKTL